MSKIAFAYPPRTSSTVSTRGLRGFFMWLKQKQPRVYRASLQDMDSGLSGLGLTAPDAVTTTEAPVAKSVVDRVNEIIMGVSSAYLTAQQLAAQKKLLDVQLKRAQSGLAPLDVDLKDYGFTGPSVSVGVSADTKQFAMLAVLGAVGLWLILRK